MANAIVSSNATQRVSGGMPAIAFVPITIAGNGATYTQGAGNGLPFDISGLLNLVVPPELVNINPADVLGLIATDASGNYVTYGSFSVTTASITYNTITNASMNVQSANSTLSACPCLVRIWTPNNAELAGGAYSGTLTGWLVVQRGGKN